jgi:hypothetical protein
VGCLQGAVHAAGGAWRGVTSVAVIVPTIGRPSLGDTLASIGNLEAGDQVLVVGDGEQISARAAFAEYRTAGWEYFEADTDPPSHYGNLQRDVGIAAAEADWLMFIDDDDEYVPGALQTVRRSVKAAPGRPHIFRMSFGAGHHAHGLTVWQHTNVVVQNVGTPMVVLPNRRYGVSWMDGDAAGVAGWTSDYRFLSHAISEAGEPVWHRNVIAMVRPLPGYRQLRI